MSLQKQVEHGVELQTIWRYWADAVNPSDLVSQLGWQPEVISTMENYHGLAVRSTFPTQDELRRVFEPEFTELKSRWPTYELGERCPILTFAPSVASFQP